MKNLLIVCLSLVTLHAYSQEINSRNFSLGPKIGVNFSNSTISGANNKSGITAGITSTYSINEMTGIGVDLMYSNLGYKSGGSTVNLDYIQLPVSYKVFLNRLGNRFRPRVEVGVIPALLVNAVRDNVSIENTLNDNDLSFLLGAGFNYRLGSRYWLNMDVRSQWGTKNVYSGIDSKNKSITINLGLAVGL